MQTKTRGTVPISELSVGDEVMTGKGFAEVWATNDDGGDDEEGEESNNSLCMHVCMVEWMNESTWLNPRAKSTQIHHCFTSAPLHVLPAR